MFDYRLRSLAAALGVSFLMSGCLDLSPGGGDEPANDEEAIQAVIGFEDNAALTDVDVRYFGDGAGAQEAPIATERWRRELLSFDKNIQVEIDRPEGEPATATVSIDAEAVGLLHLWGVVEGNEEPSEVTKDFTDHSKRSLFFERSRREPRHRGWKLVALSGVEIASPGTTRRINSVRVQGGDVDQTVTSVAELVRIEELLALPARTEVTLTVDTGDASDSVFLHLRHAQRRVELVGNGDGTFTGRFTSGCHRAPHHIGIDVLSHGTLFDDVEPYDSVGWGIPYRLVRSAGDDCPDGGPSA
jgi:hypothetical protein